MTWVLILVGGWLVVAVVAALLVGRTVHTADVIEHTEESAGPAPEPPDEPIHPPRRPRAPSSPRRGG